MDKSEIVTSLIEQVRNQYERALGALESASEAATGEDTKAESKYDTRGLEASYLAAGQAEQADELAEALQRLETFEFCEFDFDDPIGAGALVEIEIKDEFFHYLLAPAGGGIVLTDHGDIDITVLGPESPLRQKLEGKRNGDRLDDSGGFIFEVY